MINWWSWIQTEHQVVIRLSSVKIRGIHLNAVHTISNAFQVSLKNSFPVVHQKKWLVIYITKNSGQRKGKIWLVMSVGWPIFWPLLVTNRTAWVFTMSGATQTVALDIAKASDGVWHVDLLHKLEDCGHYFLFFH